MSSPLSTSLYKHLMSMTTISQLPVSTHATLPKKQQTATTIPNSALPTEKQPVITTMSKPPITKKSSTAPSLTKINNSTKMQPVSTITRPPILTPSSALKKQPVTTMSKPPFMKKSSTAQSFTNINNSTHSTKVKPVSTITKPPISTPSVATTKKPKFNKKNTFFGVSKEKLRPNKPRNKQRKSRIIKHYFENVMKH